MFVMKGEMVLREYTREEIGMSPSDACELQIKRKPLVVECGAFEYLHCPKCNRQITFDINYCTLCGQRLGGENGN